MKVKKSKKSISKKSIAALSSLVVIVIAVLTVWLLDTHTTQTAQSAVAIKTTLVHVQPATSQTITVQPAAATPTTPATPQVPVTPPTPTQPTGPCATNTGGKLLLVSITQQHLWACDGTVQVQDSPVTTGTTQIINGVDDATPTGTWSIYAKQTDRYLQGSDANGSWDDYVQYWMPFYGSYGFHDASWQTFPFGSPDYQTNGSHGCVHLPTDIAAWIYNWAPIGTTVTIES